MAVQRLEPLNPSHPVPLSAAALYAGPAVQIQPLRNTGLSTGDSYPEASASLIGDRPLHPLLPSSQSPPDRPAAQAATAQRVVATPAPAEATATARPEPQVTWSAPPPPPPETPTVQRHTSPEPAAPTLPAPALVPVTTVQRAEATAATAAAPAPDGGGHGNDPDELVKKIFDPLLRRLKAELLMDRDRRGGLTDLRY
ncbi:MAG TPA: hypothetical protein VJT31_13980 [Rugosimonospora sp.]|nr:hypothetical protein [Rugosimonospora sp.]